MEGISRGFIEEIDFEKRKGNKWEKGFRLVEMVSSGREVEIRGVKVWRVGGEL